MTVFRPPLPIVPSLVSSLVLVALLGTPLVAQPTNDTCDQATVVGLGTTAFDNTGATVGTGGAPSCYTVPTNDVWFEFVAPGSATYQIDTIGSAIDAAVAVYTGSTCPPGVLSEVICGVQIRAIEPDARVFFLASAGQTYRIRVVGQSPAAPARTTFGAGVLNIVEMPVPANDECSTPESLSVPGTVAFNTSAATESTNFACPMGPDLWYQVTAPGDGVLIVEKDRLYHHAIYPAGCPSQVADEIYCSLQGYTSTPVGAGQSYLIRVAPNVWDDAAAVGLLTVDFATSPANDDCTATTPLALGSITPVDMISATLDPSIEISCNQPPFGDNLLHADLWYSVVPPTDGVLLVELSENPEATPYHVVYALPAGMDCPVLADEVNCSQPRMSATPVVAGQTYALRIGTAYSEQFYQGDLSVQLITGLPNDECTGATPLTAGAPALVDTALASISSGYSCVIEGDLWYEYTAPTDGVMQTTLVLDEIGSHVVYHAPGGSGTCPADADELACAPFVDVSSVPVSAGETYMVRVSGTQFAGPVIGTIEVELYSAGPNDDCATPEPILGPGIIPFNTIPATGSPTLTGCFAPLEKDVWFVLTAPFDGSLIIDFADPATHAIYTAPPGGGCPTNADLIDCVDAPFFSFTPVTGGETYLIQVGHAAGYPGVVSSLSIGLAGPPANDDCLGAQLIGTVPSVTPWDTAGATDDSNGLNGGPGCLYGPYFDVWYRFVAPDAGLMEFAFAAGGNGYSSFVVYQDASGAPRARPMRTRSRAGRAATPTPSLCPLEGATWCASAAEARRAL